MLAIVLLLLAFCLTVGGVGLWSIPAALVTAGLILGYVALFADLTRKGGGRR